MKKVDLVIQLLDRHPIPYQAFAVVVKQVSQNEVETASRERLLQLQDKVRNAFNELATNVKKDDYIFNMYMRDCEDEQVKFDVEK